MTPYGRNGACGCPPPDLFATRGMISAIVDVRGTGGSEGNLEGNYFSPREARDGGQLVEYFGTRRYSTGKVGMAGGSYVGLADVAPDGTETIIIEGALRASHRELDPARSTAARPYHTHTGPRPIEPGRFYRYAIEIWPTAYELALGHRLQLRLTSTDLPTHLPGTFALDREHPERLAVGPNPPAINTVRFRGSRLLVPVLGRRGAR